MIVLKFGGTSVEDARSMKNAKDRQPPALEKIGKILAELKLI